ncbi:hypothetical protein GWI33_018210 [Rhynchophorus ferrugineus]|uniref:ER lumen protein retaining receptor n=1 Tax=Rhynchophorus ferrugineus TaxID=354439 RepID=A0A834M1R4_RHYFE|nr:hypothetical protein GWI33_018210 [Rhynchophorus ferrugineus]
MNYFSICGDVLHYLSFFILIFKICRNKSCAGISAKSQVLFATVFTVRYINIFAKYNFSYLSICKVMFLILSYVILGLIFFLYYSTYNRSKDTFPVLYIILPVLALSLVFNYNVIDHGIENYWKYLLQNPYEVAWAFSIYLEALAIVPQYIMISNTGDGLRIRAYVVVMTMYRIFYICNWIYRYYFESRSDPISFISGSIEVIILILTLIKIQECTSNNPKWQERTKIFTIEGSKIKKTSEKEDLLPLTV